MQAYLYILLLFFKVEAIQQKRTLAFLNHFITHTASFLNKFSGVCEEKLEKMSNRLQQLEITMNILEAKVKEHNLITMYNHNDNLISIHLSVFLLQSYDMYA